MLFQVEDREVFSDVAAGTEIESCHAQSVGAYPRFSNRNALPACLFHVNNISVAILLGSIQYERNFFLMRRISSLLALLALCAQFIPTISHAE